MSFVILFAASTLHVKQTTHQHEPLAAKCAVWQLSQSRLETLLPSRPKALEHGPRWVLSSSLLRQHCMSSRLHTNMNHLPPSAQFDSCLSPVLKHFYHQGPKALEHGPRWVLSSSLLRQHCMSSRLHTNMNHLPPSAQFDSCLSPVLKHFYHQGPKALEHGPRWVLSSSLLRQHCMSSRLHTNFDHLPPSAQFDSCLSPVLKHFYHQGPEALEHGPRWVLSSSLLRQHCMSSRLHTNMNHLPPSAQFDSCLSPVLKHFYHQGPKALEHGPRWVLSSSLLRQQCMSSRLHTNIDHLPPSAQFDSCLSPVLKHFYHQGPEALEHGPRWVSSSSLLRQHCMSSRLHTNMNHLPPSAQFDSCLSPVLKHFYHQGPKALEHGPRWVLSSSLLRQHCMSSRLHTNMNHMPPSAQFDSCLSPVLKHFYHQGPKALEHGPRWVLSSSLLRQHSMSSRLHTNFDHMPPSAQFDSCLSPVLKHFYHQGPKALEHGPRWVLSSSLLPQHCMSSRLHTNIDHLPPSAQFDSCLSPVLKHFYHQGPKALEHGPRWVLSSSLLRQHCMSSRLHTNMNHLPPSMQFDSSLSPVLKHFYHQGPKALEHGPRWVLSSSLLHQHYMASRLHTNMNHLPPSAQFDSCLSPVLKHFYHQGPEALEHGPRWVLSSSLLPQHCMSSRLHTNIDHLPPSAQFDSCLSPVLKHFYHQGPKALEHGPRWVLSSSLLRQHCMSADYTPTLTTCHQVRSLTAVSVPSWNTFTIKAESSGTRTKVSFVILFAASTLHVKQTTHQHEPLATKCAVWQLSQSRLETLLPSRPESSGTRTKVSFVILFAASTLHVKQTTHQHRPFANNCFTAVSVPSWNTFTIKARKLWNTDQGEFCHPLCCVNTATHVTQTIYTQKPLTNKNWFTAVSVLLKHFYHQGPKALEHGRWVSSSSLLRQHCMSSRLHTNMNHLPPSAQFDSCLSPVLKHFYLQGSNAQEQG